MFTNLSGRAAGTVLVLAAGIALSGSAYAAADYTLTPVEYGMQLKTPDGKVVFEYMTKKPDGIGLTSPSVAYSRSAAVMSSAVTTSLSRPKADIMAVSQSVLTRRGTPPV